MLSREHLKEKELFLLMHVPKSGGTSLSHIFQKQLVGDVKNLLGKGGTADKTANMALSSIETDLGKSTEALHLVFRGWRDWLDVQNNQDTLHKKKTLPSFIKLKKQIKFL